MGDTASHESEGPSGEFDPSGTAAPAGESNAASVSGDGRALDAAEEDAAVELPTVAQAASEIAGILYGEDALSLNLTQQDLYSYEPCPRCKSRNTSIFGFDDHECLKCGHTWEHRDDPSTLYEERISPCADEREFSGMFEGDDLHDDDDLDD